MILIKNANFGQKKLGEKWEFREKFGLKTRIFWKYFVFKNENLGQKFGLKTGILGKIWIKNWNFFGNILS